jgi:hypothetical protein
MMRPLVSLVTLALAALPLVAHASGSSTVDATSTYYKLEAHSVRKIFAHDPKNPNQESEWHRRWQERARETLAKIKTALDKQERTFRKTKGWELARYDDKLEPCATEAAARCRVELALGVNMLDGLTVMVVTDKPMPAAARAELKALLERLVTEAVKPE